MDGAHGLRPEFSTNKGILTMRVLTSGLLVALSLAGVAQAQTNPVTGAGNMVGSAVTSAVN